MIKSRKRKDYLIFGIPLIEEPEIQEVVDTLTISLPLSAKVTDEDAEDVMEAVAKVIEHKCA